MSGTPNSAATSSPAATQPQANADEGNRAHIPSAVSKPAATETATTTRPLFGTEQPSVPRTRTQSAPQLDLDSPPRRPVTTSGDLTIATINGDDNAPQTDQVSTAADTGQPDGLPQTSATDTSEHALGTMTDDDNVTRVGTDDDTATLVADSETITKRGADHVKARAHEPVRQHAEILAWLTKIESPAKTALFDPSSRFPTVITVNPILFMKSGLEKERLRLIQDLENDFGIQLDSRAGVTAERLRHLDAPINVLNEVQPQDFTLPILRGLRAAAGHFEQILGKRRAGSVRRGVAQEVKTVGAVTWALAGSQISPTVLGRYFEKSRLFNLYISAPRTSINVNGTASEVSDDIQYRATHELAHGLLGYAQSHFTDRLWGDQEPPPVINGRATENPERDFEFSIQAYFFDTELLVSRWPRRYAFVNKLEVKYPQILDIDKKRGSSPGIVTKEIIEELPPHEISNFMRQVGSWTGDGKRYFPWKEQPVTPYGRTNPAEDFAETAVAYFMNNGLLRGEAPQRAMFLDEIISGWSRKRPVDTVAVRGTFSSLRAVVLRGRSQSGNENTLGRIPGSAIVQDFAPDGDIITIGDTAARPLAPPASNAYAPFEEFFQNEAVRRGMSPSELETRMY
ncbi:hypothetical protein PV350_44375, partial [Streptomyces sp. PA03-6a]|nr:hypothetical protein [Streptomyces sp. PA03-6a]